MYQFIHDNAIGRQPEVIARELICASPASYLSALFKLARTRQLKVARAVAPEQFRPRDALQAQSPTQCHDCVPRGTEPHVAHLHDSTLTTRLQRPEIADFHTLHFLQALKFRFVGLAPSACR